MFNTIKKKIDAFLKKLAEQNQKEFGPQSLDCCHLHSHKTNKKSP